MRQGRLLVERAASEDPPVKGRARRSVTINEAESPLGWLRSRGHLTLRQFTAGEQLRDDWERANLAPSGCAGFAWSKERRE
jgi:hypothetical protein